MVILIVAIPAMAAGQLAAQTMVAQICERLRADAPAAADAYFDATLAAIARIPRAAFVPRDQRKFAYTPFRPLPIGYGQTISDPYIVAVMTAALRLPSGANVLDIGTGSGYQAAVLAALGHRVTSIEILTPLAEQARTRLGRLGYSVDVRQGDGFAGAPDKAPFDGIIVAAGAATVPAPLLAQLRNGGTLIMPIGPSGFQEHLIVFRKSSTGEVSRCNLGWAAFVPLTGKGERPPMLKGLEDRSVPLCYGVDVS